MEGARRQRVRATAAATCTRARRAAPRRLPPPPLPPPPSPAHSGSSKDTLSAISSACRLMSATFTTVSAALSRSSTTMMR